MNSARNTERNPDYIMQTLRLQVGGVFMGERRSFLLRLYLYINTNTNKCQYKHVFNRILFMELGE